MRQRQNRQSRNETREEGGRAVCVKRLFQKGGRGISKGRHFHFSLVWLSLDVHLITVYFHAK